MLPQPLSALFTASTSCAMSTVPPAFRNVGQALGGRMPRAIPTPVIRSGMLTTPVALQSPMHGTGVRVAVALEVGVGAVGVVVGPGPSERGRAHSSVPVSSVVAEKKSIESVATPSLGFDPPGTATSATSTVPAAVPSVFQSSRPCNPSSVVKNSVPLALVRYVVSIEVPLMGRVPASVPSLLQRSSPA